ncbi:MAG: flagellar hook capping FlgD N-terminal domain-containing protein [Steroidobacteraceae bacterium]
MIEEFNHVHRRHPNYSDSNAAGKASGNASGATPKDQLGQGEFLKLMIAQLRNQDPFKAMDPTQFLGQLAQFGTVSGIQEMQSAFTTLSDSMRASQVLDGATMVGRDVLVDQSDVAVGTTDARHAQPRRRYASWRANWEREARDEKVAQRMGVPLDNYHRVLQDAASCRVASPDETTGEDDSPVSHGQEIRSVPRCLQ